MWETHTFRPLSEIHPLSQLLLGQAHSRHLLFTTGDLQVLEQNHIGTLRRLWVAIMLIRVVIRTLLISELHLVRRFRQELFRMQTVCPGCDLQAALILTPASNKIENIHLVRMFPTYLQSQVMCPSRWQLPAEVRTIRLT